MIEYKKICTAIGCSGVGKNCPGDSHCTIVRKLYKIKIEDIKPEILTIVNRDFLELIDDTE